MKEKHYTQSRIHSTYAYHTYCEVIVICYCSCCDYIMSCDVTEKIELKVVEEFKH